MERTVQCADPECQTVFTLTEDMKCPFCGGRKILLPGVRQEYIIQEK